jgi:hypothetical protein
MLSASALGQSSRQLVIPSPPAIVVLDFANSPDSHVSSLGIVLADRLSELLNARAVGFSVVSRASLNDFLKVHWFDREETRSGEVAKWVAE